MDGEKRRSVISIAVVEEAKLLALNSSSGLIHFPLLFSSSVTAVVQQKYSGVRMPAKCAGDKCKEFSVPLAFLTRVTHQHGDTG
ncbi:hypothetical protein F2P81_009248 [Scophthalmus maximus]|uniref:Uncharacterized protein n=1 Tax=Scophthalmus maximus TaxID=52904 RepID=A0A6A4T6I0_SCOMX|nr:hypothetical protein F2P81_009248 [Scophthalmus maximus]